MSRRAAVAVAAALGLAIAGLAAWRAARADGPLATALSLAPADTSRASWTDWAGVRRELGAEVGPESAADEVDAFVDSAFERDLSSMSALGTSAGVMHEELGFSPATITWELLSQSDEGAVDIMGTTDALDLDDVARRLAEHGWTEPDEADGVWVGGSEVLVGVGPGLTPELQHVAVLADQDLILASDQAPYLEQVLEVVRGASDGADALADLAADLGEPLAAAVYDGPYACEQLAMSQADADAQAEADQLVAAAGGVHPLTGFAMGLLARGDLRAVMQVEDADDAPGDADARAQLASGPAPGQGGAFGDRFSLEEAGAEGREIILDLRPSGGGYVLSDLTSGPVIFATC
ncbi:hypothetical protein [Nocardioides sp. SYSU D00065]|uniref:hypothetical protein n=1 Tax=Nocardioides sp. SYSU D00065 TaxID=2817378 RepID=UPI001B31B9D8|nr:hypothetical protein [Nocardioides sp. SYSU D00065]